MERAFREYITAVSDYLGGSEPCLVRGWPDKRKVIREAFRKPELANRRDGLRFEYLLKEHGSEDAMWSSFGNITSIWGRINDAWQSSEETTLRESNPAYDRLTAEVDKLDSAVDPRALDEPFRDAQQKEYLDARARMQNRLRELDEELASSVAG